MTSSRKPPYQQPRLTVRQVKENIGFTPVENKEEDFEQKLQTRIKATSKHLRDFSYLNKDLKIHLPNLRVKNTMAKSRASGQSDRTLNRASGRLSREKCRARGPSRIMRKVFLLLQFRLLKEEW